MVLEELDWLRVKTQLLLLRELVMTSLVAHGDRSNLVARVLALGEEVAQECVRGGSPDATAVVRSEVLRLANDLRQAA